VADPYLVTAEQPTFNLLAFGDPGTGKTTFAASAQDHPEMKNTLFGNIEGGMLSIAHRGDIHAVDIKSTSDLEALAWAVAQGKYASVHTMVVDNITELQTLNLQEVVQGAIDGGRNMVRNRQRTVDDVWQEDYGKSTLQLSRLFRFLRDLPINIIFTAHAKRVYPKVPDGVDLSKIDPIAIVPSLSQKLMGAVMGYMDFVWCFEIDEDEEDINKRHFAVTTSKGNYRCKTRGPRFFEAIGEIIVNPQLPHIYDLFVETSTRQPKQKKRKA
jgi:hypothetical protein